MNYSTISAISILIALIGVTLNAIFTIPYTGKPYALERKSKTPITEIIGKIANGLIVLGTLGQFVVVILL